VKKGVGGEEDDCGSAASKGTHLGKVSAPVAFQKTLVKYASQFRKETGKIDLSTTYHRKRGGPMIYGSRAPPKRRGFPSLQKERSERRFSKKKKTVCSWPEMNSTTDSEYRSSFPGSRGDPAILWRNDGGYFVDGGKAYKAMKKERVSFRTTEWAHHKRG